MPPSGNNTITAQVPLAGTGIITVTTAGGRVRSGQIFTVFDPVATLRRGTVSVTTPELADGLLWQGTISLGASYSALRLSTSEPAWVRIYNSVAAQSADAARTFGDPPTSPRGLIIDEVTTAGGLARVLQGLGLGGGVGSNLDPPFTADIPITIQNRSGDTIAIQVDVARLLLENEPPPPDILELFGNFVEEDPQWNPTPELGLSALMEWDPTPGLGLSFVEADPPAAPAAKIETFDAPYDGLAFLNATDGSLTTQWDLVGSQGDQEILILYNTYRADSNNVAAFLRAATTPLTNEYQFRLGEVSTPRTLLIGRSLSSSFSALVSSSTFAPYNNWRTNRWLWLRARAQGNLLTLISWQDGFDEQIVANLTASDTSHAVGRLAARLRAYAAIKYIAGAANGKSAPLPGRPVGTDQWVEDFSDYSASDWSNGDLTPGAATVGMCPRGWTHLFRSENHHVWQCLNGELICAKTVAERQVLALIERRWPDVEVLMEVSYNAGVSGTSIGGAIVRCSGLTSTTENGYSTTLRANGDREISKYVNGVFTTMVTNNDWASYPVNTPVFHRIRAIGTDIKAKIWSGTLNDEPSDWLLEVTDSDVTSGQVGINTFVAATYTHQFFSVAYDGATATPPD
jgi:hypothetical protein